jgi:predicted DNA-binding antitoxin AbrB/MazE fold protein
MQAIKAVYNKGGFKTVQPIPVDEDYEVIITFVEPLRNDRAAEYEPKNIFDLTELGLLADDYDYKKMREAKKLDFVG